MTNFGYDVSSDKNVIRIGGGAWLNLDIENNTDKEIYVECPYSVVNGIMIESQLVDENRSKAYIKASEKLDAQIELDYDNLVNSHISKISSVWFILYIQDLKAKTAIDTKYIKLSTSTADYVQPEYNTSDVPILDENGIRAYYLGSEYDKGYSWTFHVYIVNDTEKTISLKLDDPMADGKDAFNHTFVNNDVLFPNSSAFAEIFVQRDNSSQTMSDKIDVLTKLTGKLTINQFGDESTVYASAQVSLSPKKK